MVGTIKPKSFSANCVNAGEILSDKAFAWYILYTYFITLDLRLDLLLAYLEFEEAPVDKYWEGSSTALF